MKKILAVSGGIDSMVLLDLFRADPDVVIAHFNHGTRPSSDDDQAFVERVAKQQHKPFFSAKKNLGAKVSETTARAARYQFLRQVATSQVGKIYTAHHVTDLAESIAINLWRGTGWRGLTALSDPSLERPFLDRAWTKLEIYRYAAQRQIVFRQDPTNTEAHYLRNKLRPQIAASIDQAKLYQLWLNQQKLRCSIDQDIQALLPANHIYQRQWFQNLEPTVALEILRAALAAIDITATRPQLKNFLIAIQTYAPHKTFNLPGGRLVHFARSTFML